MIGQQVEKQLELLRLHEAATGRDSRREKLIHVNLCDQVRQIVCGQARRVQARHDAAHAGAH